MPFNPKVWDLAHQLNPANNPVHAITASTGSNMKKRTLRRTKPTPPKPGATIYLRRNTDPVLSWSDQAHVSLRTIEPAHCRAEVSPCRVCGGEAQGVADMHGPWRQHAECAPLTQPWQRLRAVANWYQVPLPDDVAPYVDLHVPHYAEGHEDVVYRDNDRDRTPWSHVRRRDLQKAVLRARQALADAQTPRECETGPCAWCGIALSLDWIDADHRWPDGTSAPLCADCATLAERRGWPSPKYPDDARMVLVEAMTGVPPQAGEIAPAGVVALHEVGPQAGDGQPWSHLPAEAVMALRWNRWGTLQGKYAPADKKAEALARRAAQEADRTAALASQHADLFGFTTRETTP